MKKTLLFTLALFATGLLQAQEKMETGIAAGSGYFNSITGEHEFNLTNGFSFNGGLYILKPVFNRQFFESGLLYNFRETAIDENFLHFSQVDMTLKSLEIPIIYGCKFTNNFIVKAGFSGLLLVGKNIEKEVKPNKLVINGQLGVGYDLNLVKIFLNYQHGINKADFMYKFGTRGRMINYRQSLIKLEVNVPLIEF